VREGVVLSTKKGSSDGPNHGAAYDARLGNPKYDNSWVEYFDLFRPNSWTMKSPRTK